MEADNGKRLLRSNKKPSNKKENEIKLIKNQFKESLKEWRTLADEHRSKINKKLAEANDSMLAFKQNSSECLTIIDEQCRQTQHFAESVRQKHAIMDRQLRDIKTLIQKLKK